MTVRALWLRVNGPKYRYVAVTTLVSLLAFGRNLLFMKTLDFAALGQITLMQTLVMLVGFVQLGVINGAYIQYSVQDREMNRRIVDVMATGVLLLAPLAAIVMGIARMTGVTADLVWPGTLVIGLAAGIATLASTWLNNAMVADGLLGKANVVNLAGVLLSLPVAFLSRDHGLTAALLSVLLQPLTVAAAAILLDSNLRPRSLKLHLGTLTLLLRVGLMPFLAGLAVLAMHQVERWSIAVVLGSEALGQFYIVLMYATFFGLVPAALLNVFIPQAKRAYVASNTGLLINFVRRHTRDLFAYFTVALLATTFLMKQGVELILPAFSDSAALVYYALPGLVLFTLRDTASLVLFASGQMRPLLTAGALTLGLFCFALILVWAAGRFSLAAVLVARALATLPGTALLLIAQRRQLNEMGQG